MSAVTDRPTAAPHVLVLKGGGCKGIAYASAAKTLEQFGFRFDTFVGTSAGAIAAALLAFGNPSFALQWMLDPANHPSRLFGRWGPRALLRLLRTRSHAFPVHRFANALESKLVDLVAPRSRAMLPEGKVCFENLPKGRELVIFSSKPHGGVHIYSGKRGKLTEARTSQSVVEAVLASITIPFVFEPQRIGNALLFDGGLLANLPLGEYRKEVGPLAPSEYIALYLEAHASPTSTDQRPGPLKQQLSALVDIVVDRDDFRFARNESQSFVFINTHPIGTADFGISREEIQFLQDAGRLGVLKWLQARKETSATVHQQLAGEIPALEATVEQGREAIIRRRSRQARLRSMLVRALLLGLVGLIGWALLHGLYQLLTATPRDRVPPEVLARLLPLNRQDDYRQDMRNLVRGANCSSCDAPTEVHHAWLATPDGIFSVREFVGPPGCSVTPGLSPTQEDRAALVAVNEAGAWKSAGTEVYKAYEPHTGGLRLVVFAEQTPNTSGIDNIVAFGKKLGRLGPNRAFSFEFLEPSDTQETFTPLLYGVSSTRWERLAGWITGTPGALVPLTMKPTEAAQSLLQSQSVVAAANWLSQRDCAQPSTNEHGNRLCSFVARIGEPASQPMRTVSWTFNGEDAADGTVLLYQIPARMR